MLRGRIGSSDNHRKSLQRFIGELILFYDGVKAALRAMCQFDVHHINGIASSRFATSITWSGGTYKNSAWDHESLD